MLPLLLETESEVGGRIVKISLVQRVERTGG